MIKNRTHLEPTTLDERVQLFKRESFIKHIVYNVVSILRKPIDYARTLHQNLQTVDEESGLSPYQSFQDWWIDIISFGIIASSVFAIFVHYNIITFITYIIGFGFAMWLICESIRRIKEVM